MSMTGSSDVDGPTRTPPPAPAAAARAAPVPAGVRGVLVALTVVSGLVDAMSYLGVGHVFVANMTGNIVLMGFAIAGAKGFSIASSLVVLGSFAVGALAGGRLGVALGETLRRWLVTVAATQMVLATAAAVATAAGGFGPVGAPRFGIFALLGAGMGLQNATVRRLAVPDLTTTVMTMTVTGLAADSSLAGGDNRRAVRRMTSVAAMLVGGFAGAVLVLHTNLTTTLAVVAAAYAAVAVGFSAFSGPPAVDRPGARLAPA